MLETSSTSTAEIIAFPSRHLPEGHGLFLGSATTPANTGIVGLVVKMAHRPCRACGGDSLHHHATCGDASRRIALCGMRPAQRMALERRCNIHSDDRREIGQTN